MLGYFIFGLNEVGKSERECFLWLEVVANGYTSVVGMPFSLFAAAILLPCYGLRE